VPLGLDHAAVGRALAEHWKFPLLIQRAIADHHAPRAQDLGAIPSVVHVADAIVHALDLAGHADELVPAIAPDAWNSLGIDAAGLRRCQRDRTEFDNVSDPDRIAPRNHTAMMTETVSA
jgi:hypothetical protein